MVHGWRHDSTLVIGLEMAFARHLDEIVLRRASALVIDAEPILGCRLVADAYPPHWAPVATRNVFVRFDSPGEYDTFRLRTLDVAHGPQLEVGLLRNGSGDRVLLRLAHEAGDGASLQYLAARLGEIYSALCHDDAHVPAVNEATDRGLTQILAQVPTREYPGILWKFFRFVLPRLGPRRALELPLPESAKGPATLVVRQVPPRRTAFLAAFGKARGATINDMFLAAAYRALADRCGWDGSSGLRIPMTVNLRRWGTMKERPGPVCNLSAYECPFLGRELGRDFEDTLDRVRLATGERKRNLPGGALAILVHLKSKVRGSGRPLAASSNGGGARVDRGVTFSNEGALERAGVRFGSHVPTSACVIPPYFPLPRFHMSLSGYGGGLTLLSVTAENGRPVVESFFDAVLDALPQHG